MSTVRIRNTVALTIVLALLNAACAPRLEQSSTTAPDAGRPPPPALPPPTTFGMDLTGSPALDPKTTIVQAPHVQTLEPDITALEVTTDIDGTDKPGHAYDERLTIRAVGADGTSGRLLVDQDTHASAGATFARPELRA